MKLFLEFRLDTANHLLWKDGERVPLAPKAFDVLSYLVAHAGQVVTQDEIFDALWVDSFVNPEVLRKYILEIRRALGDKAGNPEFIETLPKRGYRFVAPVIDEQELAVTQPVSNGTNKEPETASQKDSLVGRRRKVVYRLTATMIVIVVVLLGSFRRKKDRAGLAPNEQIVDCSVALCKYELDERPGVFFRRTVGAVDRLPG
jgi:DNA-binding winged helix-turn-helix (wHTH) protein